MIAFVFCSVLAGLVAGVFVLISGAPLISAIFIYVGVGTLTIFSVLIRTLICQHISEGKFAFLRSF